VPGDEYTPLHPR